MITSTSWRGKRYAVLGLARSGLATVRALLASRATVVAWDANEKARLDFIEAFKGFGRGRDGAVEHFWAGESNNEAADDAKVELGNLEVSELAEFDALVVSPGVPLNRDHTAMLARSAGTPIIGDIELFAEARAEMPAHRVVGITGTNGKSTTTALIHHIVETAGIPTRMGGNIGLPILGQEPLPAGGVYVLELSSYQIDLTHSLDCDVAVLLNITPDHLDRYAGFDAYAESKVRLFEMQSKGHAAIIGIGDETCANVARRLADFGRSEDLTRIAPGICMDQSRWPALQGPHNAQNALAAIAACQALGIDQTAIDKGLESFPGLPHRMERVKTVNGVLFVNDSKATNADSTAPALSAYPKIHWILGGKAKTNDLDACRPGFPHVVKAYTIGDAGEMFAKLLEGEMPVERSGTLDVAVKAAAANAQPGEVVLLSPACASFDQFKDYEARGQAFRDAVEALG